MNRCPTNGSLSRPGLSFFRFSNSWTRWMQTDSTLLNSQAHIEVVLLALCYSLLTTIIYTWVISRILVLNQTLNIVLVDELPLVHYASLRRLERRSWSWSASVATDSVKFPPDIFFIYSSRLCESLYFIPKHVGRCKLFASPSPTPGANILPQV